MDKRKIILDSDPGHDDAIALILAGKNPKIDLLGLTIEAGNQTIEKTVKNALNLVQYLKIDTKVYKGCSLPMVRNRMIAKDIHGETGLDGPIFDELKICEEKIHAVQFIIECLLESKDKITIVTTGPMTNLAMALRLEPRISEKIYEIILMGGSYTNGNVSPAAEFNILSDAEAAYVCFNSNIPITMVGLDVTRKVLCYPHIVERMKKINNRASKLFVDLMNHFNKSQKEVFGWDGGPLHDPLTIAYLIEPSVLKTKEMYTTIDIGTSESYGRTNCDYFSYLNKKPNSNIAVSVDVDKFWNIVEDSLKLYD